MAHTIHVDVVSAEESIYSGEAEFVVLPGVAGELGIYPKHTPLLTQIKPGAVRIKVPNEAEETLVFVQGGFLEVQPNMRDGARRHRDPRARPRRSEGARGQGEGRGRDAEQALGGGDRQRTGRALRRGGPAPGDRAAAQAEVARARVANQGRPMAAFLLPAT